MTLSQGSFFVLQFIGSIILARLLTPYDMGIYAVAAAITGVISALQAFGLAGFIVREHDLTPQLLATSFTINTALAVLLAVIVAGLSPLAEWYLHESGIRHVMLVLAVLPLFGAFEFVPAAGLERRGQFKSIALVGLARMACSTTVTIGLALVGFSYMSIAYGNLAGAVVSLIGFNSFGRQHVSVRVSLADWRRVSRFGLQMTAISGINSISSRTAEFMLGHLLGLGALGLYSRASSLNSLLWDNIHLVIGRVVFVDLASIRREGISLRNSYLRTLELVTALLWPAFAGFAILAGPLIRAVYGDQWTGAALPLSMLSIASILLVSITMTWEIFVVCGETGRQARFETFRTGVGLLLFLCGCLVGLTGAAASRIGEAVFSVAMYRKHLERMTQTAVGDFMPIYLRSAFLTVTAVAPSAILMVSYQWSERTPIPYVLASIPVGLAAWALALRLLHHPFLTELTRMAATLRRIVSHSGIPTTRLS